MQAEPTGAGAIGAAGLPGAGDGGPTTAKGGWRLATEQ